MEVGDSVALAESANSRPGSASLPANRLNTNLAYIIDRMVPGGFTVPSQFSRNWAQIGLKPAWPLKNVNKTIDYIQQTKKTYYKVVQKHCGVQKEEKKTNIII
jgi:hypothetical protein